MGQLKSALYARMEEVSFRAGAAVAGSVLTAAGVAITLAVVPSGHSDAAAIAPVRAAAPSLAPPPVAPVSSAPSPTPLPSRTAIRATAAGTYQPPSAARASAARQAAATSALGRTPTPASAGSALPTASGNAARLLALAPAAAVAIWPATASPPPLIAALGRLVATPAAPEYRNWVDVPLVLL